MSRPIDPRTGQLQDYIPRRGDPDPNLRPGLTSRQKWGGRSLLSNDPAVPRPASSRQTLIATGDLGLVRTLNVQLRFAVNGPANQPVLPFRYAAPPANATIKVTVRRGVDPTSGVTDDTYIVEGTTANLFPIDMISARTLGVDVEAISDPAGNMTTVWVEAIATPVDYPGPMNLVHPWGIVNKQITFSGIAGGAISLRQNSDRVQFFIVNAATDADFYIGFKSADFTLPAQVIPAGDFPTIGPPPTNTALILPRGGFATYESPCPCGFKGDVLMRWSNASAAGFALITEGVAYKG